MISALEIFIWKLKCGPWKGVEGKSQEKPNAWSSMLGERTSAVRMMSYL